MNVIFNYRMPIFVYSAVTMFLSCRCIVYILCRIYKYITLFMLSNLLLTNVNGAGKKEEVLSKEIQKEIVNFSKNRPKLISVF